MKITLLHLLTAATACSLCSFTVARPVDVNDLEDGYQDGDVDYDYPDLSRRVDDIDQDRMQLGSRSAKLVRRAEDVSPVLEGPETEAFRPTFPAVNQEEDIDDSDEPIAEIERRVDDDNNTDYTTDDDYLSEEVDSAIDRRGVPVKAAAAGAEAGAAAGGKAGNTVTGGAAKADLPIGVTSSGKAGADTPAGFGAQVESTANNAGKSQVVSSTGSKAENGAKAGAGAGKDTKPAGTRPCKRTGECMPAGLSADAQKQWTDGNKILQERPPIGAPDSTKWGDPNKVNMGTNYKTFKDGEYIIPANQLHQQPDLLGPMQRLGINDKQAFYSIDIRSKAAGSERSVLECDMTTTGRPAYIAEQRIKAHDKNPKPNQIPVFVLTKETMLKNKHFKPEELVARHIKNTDTQRTAVNARKELKPAEVKGQPGYFTLSSDSTNAVEQKWFRMMMATDNVRPYGNMLNAFPRYFDDGYIQTIHIWKNNDAVHKITGQFTMAMTLKFP